MAHARFEWRKGTHSQSRWFEIYPASGLGKWVGENVTHLASPVPPAPSLKTLRFKWKVKECSDSASMAMSANPFCPNSTSQPIS